MATPQRTRDIYIVRTDTITAAGTEYGVSQPIPGTGKIVQLSFVPSLYAEAPGELRVELRWVDALPTTATEFLAGELVFPKMVQTAEIRGLFRLPADAGILNFWGPFEIAPRGRMLAARTFNNTAAQISLVTYVVVATCHDVQPDPQDGAC